MNRGPSDVIQDQDQDPGDILEPNLEIHHYQDQDQDTILDNDGLPLGDAGTVNASLTLEESVEKRASEKQIYLENYKKTFSRRLQNMHFRLETLQ